MQTSQVVASEVIQVQSRGSIAVTLQQTRLYASNSKPLSNNILACPKQPRMVKLSLTLNNTKIPPKSTTTKSSHVEAMHSNIWVNLLSKTTLAIWHNWSHLVKLLWDQALAKVNNIIKEHIQTDKFHKQPKAKISRLRVPRMQAKS